MPLTLSWSGDFLLLLVVGLAVIHSIRLHATRRWLAFDPLNFLWAGVFVVYVMQPVMHAATLRTWHQPGIFEATLFWAFFTLSFVVAGYEMASKSSCAMYLPSIPSRLIPVRLTIVSFLFIGLGCMGYAYLISSAGDFKAWLAVSRGGTDWESVSKYVALLENFLPLGVGLLLFQANLHRLGFLLRLAAWLMAGLMWLWFVYLGTRSRTIMFTGMMMMAYYLPRRRNPPFWMISVVFVFLFLLVRFQENYRSQFTDLSFNLGTIDVSEAKARILPSFLSGAEAAKDEQVSTGLEFNCNMAVVELVPKVVDYNYGKCLLEFFTRLIPRRLWPEKPYPHYEAFTPIYDQGDLSSSWVEGTNVPILAGPSFTLVGHYYAIGGPFALILGGLFTGALLGLIRSYWDRFPQREGLLVVLPFVSSIGFFEATATPLFWIFTLPFALAPLLVSIHFCRETSTIRNNTKRRNSAGRRHVQMSHQIDAS